MGILARLNAAGRALLASGSEDSTAVVEQKQSTFAFPSSSLTYAMGLWPSNTGVPITPIASLQAATVYACIRRLSEDLAKLNIRLLKRSRRGGWVEELDHPLVPLLRKPNGWQTTFGLVSYVITSIQMRGNGYLFVVRRSDGSPKNLIPLMPERVSVLMTSEGGELYYSLNIPQLGYETIYASPEDIIHVRNFSLDAGVMGVSPIACSQDVVGLALAAQRHGALFFRQGTALNGVLESPKPLSREAAMNLAGSFQHAYAGSDNAHRTAVLEDGVKFTPIGITPEDAQLLETQKWSAEQICRVFGVPPWLVGLPVPTGTYSNVEQSQIQYVTNTLSGLANNIEAEMERVLFFDDERADYKIEFDFDSLLRGDLKSRMESYQMAAINGFLSINEIREREGLEAIDGGDEHRIPVNLAPASAPTVSTEEIDIGQDKA